ncbi:cell division cycle-associated protein 7-like [Cynoglossus semilaevis]|uniref:Cell division cycle-associated protein 7-like n=1 Tax=Cynoglossus semilaevis TaxID=244447 RepID=A0A3P8VVR7_CYNSE|nr:cell division cycle-associated protein 7-like [Cynoglossus semilaevis]
MASVLAGIFADDSENEQTFYGFSDSELKDIRFEEESESDLSPKMEEPTAKLSTRQKPFRLRVALRSKTQHSGEEKEDSDDDDDDDDIEVENRGKKKTGESVETRRERHVQFKDEPTSPCLESGSDSKQGSFLEKRAQNIKANKAMLAQLMADLEKMPGREGFLKNQAEKQKTKRQPRSGADGFQSRRNPDRASRRHTRSMGGSEDSSSTKEEVELSLEEELLEVRRAPQRRGTPRPAKSKPHVVRPVEDITEEELELVAENMTEKVYNSVSGSTCHQCRQKTIDTKTCCRSEECRGIQGQFCGPCLRNRYGEDVRKVLLDPGWKCPPCRGICNCSFCRQREGHCPTGILFPLAQYHGFSDVHSYLSSLRQKLKAEENDVEM